MTTPLVILGGGEHARVVIDAARSRAYVWSLLGIVDPEACERTCELMEVQRLGDDAILAAWRDRATFVLGLGGIGSQDARRALVERVQIPTWAAIVHGSAWVSPRARLEPGAVIMAGAVVNAGTHVGPHVVINTGAIVEHDCVLGSYAQVAPGAVLGGGVKVGDGAYIGLGARVRDHRRIGAGALVGMGAVVVDDIEAGVCVTGVPARPHEVRS